MLKPQSTFTPLNAYRSTLTATTYTAPSSFFTLDPIPLDADAGISGKVPSTDKSAADASADLAIPDNMASRHLYDCFNKHGKGHLHSADEFYDRGIWVGYLAEESRNTQYRQLPSFHELEDNFKTMTLPSPKPLPDSFCSDREAVCRGCFTEKSTVLRLREIRFGPQSKVLIMPLSGADDAELFCILLRQPMVRSIKALEAFRPYEHRRADNDTKPFANDYMLLTVRDRESNSSVLQTVSETLDREELSKIKTRSERQCSDSGQTVQAGRKPTVEKKAQDGRSQKAVKRKQQGDHLLQDSNEGIQQTPNKRCRTKPITGPRMSSSIVNLSDDDMAGSLVIPNVRGLSSRSTVQQQPLVSPNNFPRLSPVEPPAPPNTNKSFFTDEQAKRIYCVYKFDFEGIPHETTAFLSDSSTFRGLLDSFREDAEPVPSATRQLNANLWYLAYRLADGKRKAVTVNLVRPSFEFNFGRLLRSLAEASVWGDDPDTIVEIEFKAMTVGKD